MSQNAFVALMLEIEECRLRYWAAFAREVREIIAPSRSR